MTVGWNPYLDEWRQVYGADAPFDWWAREDRRWSRRAIDLSDPGIAKRAQSFTFCHAQRELLIARYAFAVPSEEALDAIAALGPVVEMGAGTGYWARCLRERGADVLAYDAMGDDWHRWFRPRRIVDLQGYGVAEEDPDRPEPVPWTDIRPGGPERLPEHSDRALLLCWPDYNSSFAEDCLLAYRGRHVVYVGEWGGCTGTDAFHAALESGWENTAEVAIPQWEGIHDALWVYRRRG